MAGACLLFQSDLQNHDEIAVWISQTAFPIPGE
jgi:hypothetical protein